MAAFSTQRPVVSSYVPSSPSLPRPPFLALPSSPSLPRPTTSTIFARGPELLGLGAGPGLDTPLRGEPAARAILSSALAEKVSQAERRIFLLLAVLYPDADMEQIYAGIHDAAAVDAPRRRANATELLDNLLARNVKRRFLPLLEELPRAKKLELVAEMYAPRPRDVRTVLTDLCRDETAWVRARAVWCLSQLEQVPPDLGELLASSRADQNAVVRESALVALVRVAPMRAREIAESRLRDEAPLVRREGSRRLRSAPPSERHRSPR